MGFQEERFAVLVIPSCVCWASGYTCQPFVVTFVEERDKIFV